VFAEPLLRNGLHNPVVSPLLGADDIENTASSVVACWAVFTELLPGNALIKSVTIHKTNALLSRGHAVAWLVETLCYKPEGRGFDSRCRWIFQLV
jgi:hypothetical protein